jgi:hypothetical protein
MSAAYERQGRHACAVRSATVEPATSFPSTTGASGSPKVRIATHAARSGRSLPTVTRRSTNCAKLFVGSNRIAPDSPHRTAVDAFGRLGTHLIRPRCRIQLAQCRRRWEQPLGAAWRWNCQGPTTAPNKRGQRLIHAMTSISARMARIASSNPSHAPGNRMPGAAWERALEMIGSQVTPAA